MYNRSVKSITYSLIIVIKRPVLDRFQDSSNFFCCLFCRLFAALFADFFGQCFQCLNFFQFFSIFFQFFPIFGQKGRLNYNFRTNFALLIINKKKPNMGLIICLLWTIFCYLKMLTIFEKIATLKH